WGSVHLSNKTDERFGGGKAAQNDVLSEKGAPGGPGLSRSRNKVHLRVVLGELTAARGEPQTKPVAGPGTPPATLRRGRHRCGREHVRRWLGARARHGLKLTQDR